MLLAEANAGDWHLAGTRILNTALGGGLALAGSRLLWPSPEVGRLPSYLAEMVRAMRGYFERELADCKWITHEVHKRRSNPWQRLKWALSHFLVNVMDYSVTRRLNVVRR